MKTVDYDTLAASAPINRDAAIARDGKSKHGYEPSKKIAQAHWTAPPRTIAVPRCVTDLTGKKIGNLAVIGLLERDVKKGAIWLMRCLCGDYVSRRSKSINNPANSWDRCDKCRYVLHLRRDDIFHRTGKRVTYEELQV